MTKRAFLLTVAAALCGTEIGWANDKIDFEKQIQPIFVEHCTKCHGADKAQGKMRLNTAAALQEKVAADPELLVSGDPDKSELFRRITLPADDAKRMPKGADPLSKESIELIANWIRQGAAISAAAVATPASEPPAAPEALALPEVPPASQEAIDRLTESNVQVIPLFGGSSLLQISFSRRDQPAGDAEIGLLSGVADQVYVLDLARSKPTDGGLAPLAALKNLAILHLENSSVTDEGLAHVAGLPSLQYLNLYGTGISDAGLKQLGGLKQLNKLYLWQTKVSYDAAMALEKDTPGLMVNLGYNHPMVVKLRLTKEMEVAKKQAEEAAAEAKKVEQQLEAAKKNVETSGQRIAEIEKELKALDAPTEDDKPNETADSAPPEAESSSEAKSAETDEKK